MSSKKSLYSAAEYGRKKAVSALIRCQRNAVFDGANLGTALRLAADYGQWNVVDEIRARKRYAAVAEFDRQVVEKIEQTNRPPSDDESGSASDEDAEVVAAMPPDEEEDL